MNLILSLLFKSKETVGILTNPKKSIQGPKINSKKYETSFRWYSQLHQIRCL